MEQESPEFVNLDLEQRLRALADFKPLAPLLTSISAKAAKPERYGVQL